MSPELLAELKAKPVGPTTPIKPAEKPEEPTRELELNGDTLVATISDEMGMVTEDLATKFITDEGLNPDDWEIWRWYKGKYGNTWVDEETGERMWAMETIKFHYKRRVEVENASLSLEVVDRCRSLIEGLEVPQNELLDGSGTYTALIADPQFGKKGTAQAVENYQRGIKLHLERAYRLCGMGEVGAIHLGWMGDETEGVANNYANQAYTIELNQSEQLELDYEMRVWALKEALSLGLPVSASSVISNHGEWTRNGSKDVVTSKGDNASTYVARQVKALFDELEPHTGQNIEWTIGEDSTPGLVIPLSGVECYFSHGYIEKGKGGSTELRTKSAIERQILGKTELLGAVQIWFMAHYHHLWQNEFEGRTAFGCPALEAERSSEYMLEQFGVWSPAGMLGLVVSDRYKRGWSDLNVF